MKKFCVILIFTLVVMNCLTCFVAAARTGEFETNTVEFNALVPGDFDETVEIKLKHVEEQWEISYFLYGINDFFSNELVPVGTYDVTVMTVTNATKFGYIYEKSLSVSSSNLAIPFTIIIDNLSFGDDELDDEYDDELDDEYDDWYDEYDDWYDEFDDEYDEEDDEDDYVYDDNYEGDFWLESVNNPERQNASKSNSAPLWVSIFITVVIFVVLAGLLWFFCKNK